MRPWEPSEAELAYAAGLFEGEGSASIRTDRRHPEGSASRTGPALYLAMRDEEPVRRFAAIMGFGTIWEKKSEELYCWRSGSKMQAERIRALLPWLSPRRRAQIETMLGGYVVGDSPTVYLRQAWKTRRERYGVSGRRS